MKQFNPLPYINYKNAFWTTFVLFIISIFLLTKSCKNSEPAFVKTPEIKGSFKTDTIPKQNLVYLPKPYFNRSNEGKLKNDIVKLNTQLRLYKEELDNAIDEFNYADSLHKSEMFSNAIALREFTQPFEDDFIKIENSGFVSGTLKSLETSYTIKSQKIEVPQLKHRLLVGVGFANNSQFNAPLYNAGLGYQNKKGNVLIGSYDNEKRISISYYHSLFKK